MGLIDMDNLVGAAIDKTEEKLDNEGKKAERNENKLVRFIISLIWFVVNVAISFIVAGIAIFKFVHFNGNINAALIIGIVLSAVFALITFLVPYLRRGIWTRWWGGILPIGDIIWWIYQLIQEVN